jgi:hypothetical protein
MAASWAFARTTLVGMEGITDRDMDDYRLPDVTGIEAHFLGAVPAVVVAPQRAGRTRSGHARRIEALRALGNGFEAENLDNAQTGLHDYFAWLKFRYSRGTAQISIDIREGNISREHALVWLEQTEHLSRSSMPGCTGWKPWTASACRRRHSATSRAGS